MRGVPFLEAVLAVCAGLSGAQQQTDDPLSIDTLCSATLCAQNSTCRVIQTCPSSACPSKAACLTCVPKGSDDVCSKSGFFSAVLMGSTSQPSALIGRGCDPNQPDGEPNCPAGSMCVPDDHGGRGTCCYGKLNPSDQTEMVATNNRSNTTFCRSECGECQPEHVCRKIVAVCKKLPCPPRYVCVQREKKGLCPRSTRLGSSWCPRNVRIHCNTDIDCLGSQKCCSDPCGGLRCKKPRK